MEKADTPRKRNCTFSGICIWVHSHLLKRCSFYSHQTRWWRPKICSRLLRLLQVWKLIGIVVWRIRSNHNVAPERQGFIPTSIAMINNANGQRNDVLVPRILYSFKTSIGLKFWVWMFQTPLKIISRTATRTFHSSLMNYFLISKIIDGSTLYNTFSQYPRSAFMVSSWRTWTSTHLNFPISANYWYSFQLNDCDDSRWEWNLWPRKRLENVRLVLISGLIVEQVHSEQ